jgi:leucine dehydrogenase
MEAPIFTYMTKYRYRKVVLCQNADVGLKAVIAIHSTTLGPATGGTRMWTYRSEADAIVDAMRLARGMTYKYAAAGVDLGGGKCVIIGDPKTEKTEGLLRALGRFIQSLGGEFQTGEDVGTTLDDMEVMAAECDYIVTLPEHAGGAGPIAPATAFGVLQAMNACCREVYGSESLKGRRVSLQGLGAVGAEMLKLLAQEGAQITATDIDEVKVRWAQREVGARAVAPDALYAEPSDIFCPCALGGILNDEVIPALRCRIVCGSANNQLWEERHGDELHRRGILYAPDYIVNAGGTIFDTDRLGKGGFNRERAMRNVARIGGTMERLIARSKGEGIPTWVAADRLAEERLAMKERVRLI